MEAPDEGIKPEFPYQPGTIKRITLHNFMCHEKFDLVLGPRVNFIIGPNGSGKSALLTALVVVLGGRATTTSRAKRVSDFVQEGKKVAKITCVIHNYAKVMDRDQAYKPDEFGKEIVVEKTIYKDDVGGTKLIIKDDKMRKVSERKQVLDDILEHFKILINNPICILNQEVSKSFLHSKRPEDKFDLFMKATNLEQIENDYQEARQAYSDWDGINTKKSLSFKLLDKEFAECKEKINFIQNRLKLQDRSEELNIEMLWAILRDKENDAKAIEATNESLTTEVTKNHSEITRREEAISTAQSEIEQFRARAQAKQVDLKEIKERLDEIRKKESGIRPEMINVKHAIDGAENKITRLERSRSQIEKKIQTLRNDLGKQDSQADEEARRKLEQERLEFEVVTEQNNEKTKRLHGAQLNNSMTELRTEITRTSMKLNEMNQDMNYKNTLLKRLIGGRDSELKKYGDYMVKICAQVDAAYNEGLFSKKPRGPLGFFIKLKSPKIAKALEIHLGKNAHAFTVDNIQDMGKLAMLIKKVKANFSAEFRDPIILTRKFTKKHDVSRFNAGNVNYKTLLDLVDIEDENVYNALVDRTSLEQILFIEDYFEAQNVMITPSSVPKGTRCAYTENGDTMYPRTNRGGFRTVANNRKNLCLFSKGNDDQIRELKQEIADLKTPIEHANDEIKQLQRNYDEQRHEFNLNQAELKSISERLKEKEGLLFKIKTAIPMAQPQELSDLETDLEEFLEQIRATRVNMEREKLRLEAITAELNEIQQKRNLHLDIQTQKEREISELNCDIGNRKELISDCNLSINQIKLAIANAEKTQVENKSNLEKIYQDVEKASRMVADRERPDVIRSTSAIRSDQATVARQLQVEIDENQEPDELLANYRKRIDEIAKTVSLKEHNLKNYKLSEKSLKDRDEGTSILRNHTCGSVGSTFASVMRAMDMEGKLNIYIKDHVVGGKVVAKARTLEMSIDTSTSQRPGTLSMSDRNAATAAADKRSSRSQPPHTDGPQSKRARLNLSPSEKENQRMTDTRSLSGGERSFSTVAFVLALWHHCASPFKLMDEIDVFMDMVTRRMSYNALIKFAEATENPGQFIYFSPLQLPEIDATKGLVKVLSMPSIVRRGQSQAASLNANERDDH